MENKLVSAVVIAISFAVLPSGSPKLRIINVGIKINTHKMKAAIKLFLFLLYIKNSEREQMVINRCPIFPNKYMLPPVDIILIVIISMADIANGFSAFTAKEDLNILSCFNEREFNIKTI